MHTITINLYRAFRVPRYFPSLPSSCLSWQAFEEPPSNKSQSINSRSLEYSCHCHDQIFTIRTTSSPTQMLDRGDGLLEKGLLENEYWETIQPDSPLPSPTRKSWGTDIIRPLWKKRADSPARPLRRTAYLDGLRGFAAFLVYWHHHQLWAHEYSPGGRYLEDGFGFEDKHYFACLHGVRTFFTGGHFAVTVFFVISGHVLSAKPMSLIHARDFTKLGDNLASSFFRRWLRLYIPVICTTFLFMTSLHAFGLWTANVDQQSTYGAEVWKWYSEFKNFSYVFKEGGVPWFTYNFHVWSIPVEFKGSMIIYASLLAFSRCTRNARLWCQVGLIIYLMYIADAAHYAMFVGGMLLCDLDLLATGKDQILPRAISKMESFKELIFYQLFILSIYLGSVPSGTSSVQDLRSTPGWYYLSFLKPQAVYDYKWFFLFWAALFLVASVPRIPWLKAFFETSFNQYLGRISFAFYLVHGPVLWILGDRFYAATGWARESHASGIPGWVDQFPLSKAGPLGLEWSFLVSHLTLLPVTFGLAELATRLFDGPSVKIANWLYGKTLAGSAR